jgi:predicted dehydrogenase
MGMSMKTYKALVIGCGKIGATFEIDSSLVKPASHAAAFKANPRTELVGLVDPIETARNKAREYYQVPVYADAEAAIEETKPDIVVISTPPTTHEEYLKLALQMNVPAVLCEKPVSQDLESAERMIALSNAHSSIVILNHQRRFFPLFKEAKAMIERGELGRVQQVSCYYSNGLENNATHSLDAVQFLLNDHALWAIGVENSLNKTAPFGTNIDGMVGFSKGAVVTLQSLDNAEFGIHDLVFYGTNGALFVGQFGFRFKKALPKDGVTFPGAKELDWEGADNKFDKRSMLEATTEHVVECLDGKAPESTLTEGYHTMQILEALSKSAKEESKRIMI